MTRYVAFLCLTLPSACSEDSKTHPPSTSTAPSNDASSKEVATCTELKEKGRSIALLDEQVGCQEIGSSCTLDTECCCGECYPTELCECTKDGWSCQVADAVCAGTTCDDAASTSAPTPEAEAEAGVDAATSSECGPLPKDVDLTETECCCGCCSPSQFCVCEDGKWACGYTDYCVQFSECWEWHESMDAGALLDFLPPDSGLVCRPVD